MHFLEILKTLHTQKKNMYILKICTKNTKTQIKFIDHLTNFWKLAVNIKIKTHCTFVY
jgi:hypothetical protein